MKKILFLTSTRADYGKMKSLMKIVEESENFECHVFVTGMHTLSEFGNTGYELVMNGFKNIHTYMNQIIEEPMDLVLANTINGFGRYIRELKPDMIVIHGDRVEALACAITGALNNVLVAHIEGGEVSGTIDESIRHAISKFAHIHFVSNETAKKRVLQLGEDENRIFVIGSPDIDIMIQRPTKSIEEIKKHYEIEFDRYAVLIYHPVITELNSLKYQVCQLVDAVMESGDKYVVINPNNDHGYNIIQNEYERLSGSKNFRRFPTIRFEYYIELLRNSDYIIGNSSSGIYESTFVGVPSIDIGTRQKKRFKYESIISCESDKRSILKAILKAKSMENMIHTTHFGDGNSAEKFFDILCEDAIWKTVLQKDFSDFEVRWSSR